MNCMLARKADLRSQSHGGVDSFGPCQQGEAASDFLSLSLIFFSPSVVTAIHDGHGLARINSEQRFRRKPSGK